MVDRPTFTADLLTDCARECAEITASVSTSALGFESVEIPKLSLFDRVFDKRSERGPKADIQRLG
jgi:hypothetical protein